MCSWNVQCVKTNALKKRGFSGPYMVSSRRGEGERGRSGGELYTSLVILYTNLRKWKIFS